MTLGHHDWLIAVSILLFSSPAVAVQQLPAEGTQASIRLDIAQAQGTIELLAARARGEDVAPSRWSQVFVSEGNRRVLEREKAMDERLGIDRGISDESFLTWAQSDEALDQLEARKRTLTAWTVLDVVSAGSRAMQYLPPHVKLSATVYPIVRKQSNSFVWDLPDNPAIFVSVEPDVGLEELKMTLIHELHHVGLSGACREPEGSAEEGLEDARGWLSGFAEGLAVLAAAGGPDRSTHAAGQSDLQKAWAARLDSLEIDMRRMETFLLDVAEGRTEGTEARQRGMAFINAEGVPQGAFYSLGWFMGATVERQFGRDAVIATTCNHGRLLMDYQRAAILANRDQPAEPLPLWSEHFLEVLKLGSM